jgi:TolB-like protein/class 3 adenylate cyclase/Tfp pilus assembly protein PilF
MLIALARSRGCDRTGARGPSLGEAEPTRKLTTILSADAAEYSRMMRADEDGTFRALRLCRQAIDRYVADHQGRIFATAGDSVVAEFPSPVEALRCAVDIQQGIAKIDEDLPDSNRLKFRIGINLGDVLIAGTDLIGDGVNVAARIQHLAQPGETYVSASVHALVKNQPDLAFDDLGRIAVKNIAEPVHIHRLRGAGVTRRRRSDPARKALLSALAVVGAIFVLGAGLYLAFPNLLPAISGTAPQAQFSHPAIAVLPFENLSGDAAQDYFADGITEDVILALGRFSDLTVIAREAVQQYKNSAMKPGDLSRDLGVRYALQGSVRRDGDRVRVTAVLSDAMSGVQLWSDRYDGEVRDVFAVQDDITQKVVGTLAIKLSDIERQRSLAKPPENLQAYDYLQRGLDYYRRNTRADNREARKLFEQAIALDPRYASAYVALARTRVLASTSGWTELMAEALTEAEQLAQKALSLDSGNAEAHQILADVYLNRGDYDLARAEADQAIALNPNDATSHAARGGTLVFAGDPEEALKSFAIAQRLNPSMELFRLYPIGWAYYLTGRYEDAVRVMEAGLAQSSSDYFLHAALAASYAQLGRKEDAARAAAATLRAWPFFKIEVFIWQFKRVEDRSAIRVGLYQAGLK